MIKVVSVENMKKSDAATIAQGTLGKELMWRAGQAVFDNAHFLEPIAIVCGSGNNAGDGFVLASMLNKAGKKCTIFLLADKFSLDGKYYFLECQKQGIPIEHCTASTDFNSFKTIVDCIFGTGFSGSVRGLAQEIISKINSSSAYIISLDINSGLGGDSGLADLCVHSDLTVSIADFKAGHFLNMAKDVIKKKINCDIGICLAEPPFWLVEAADIKHLFVRGQYSNKGSYGYVVLIGGSIEYSGAAKLANLALCALRAGAGVAKLAVPSSICHSVMPYLLESTLFPLSDNNGSISYRKEEIDNLLKNTKAAALGMGIGQSAEIKQLLLHILSEYNGVAIIDADGLNVLATMDKRILQQAKCKVILTPHLKEFERLSGIPIAEINKNPINISRQFAKQNGVILLLKGPCTIITDGKQVYLTDKGTSGMATAGSGDVLSGILAGVCGYAKEQDLLLSVAASAYINGLAGELAQAKLNAVSMLASDTIACIGEAISKILTD